MGRFAPQHPVYRLVALLLLAGGLHGAAHAAAPAFDRAREVTADTDRDLRITGLGHVFTISGLDLLDEVWATRQNPNPPMLCGPVVRRGGQQGVWVNDVDADFGRETQSVRLQLGKGDAIVEVDAPATKPYDLPPPKECPKEKYFEVNIESPVAGARATDDAGNSTAWLPPVAWPPKNAITLIEDDNQPEAELFADYDIVGLWGGLDKDWLYLSMKVDGKISDGTTAPPEGHLYTVLLMDPKEGDRVVRDRVNGFSLQYMSLYRLANQPPQVLLRLRQDRTKLNDKDVEARVDGDTVHWRVKRTALKLSADRSLKIIGAAGEARLGPGTVHFTVKDITPTGQLQFMP